jgi:NitT/TauT family transport system permease protein
MVLLLAGLAVWEAVSGRLIEPFWISRPTFLAVRLWKLAVSGDLFWHTSVTVQEAVLGLLAGMAVGLAAGLFMAGLPRFAEVADPFLMGVYSLPRVALAPLFIIWFGIGLFSKVMLAFSLVVFVFLLNTYEGVRSVDRELVDMMRVMQASRTHIIRKVIVPSIMPWIFAATRISIGMALIGAVVSELVGSSRGLGWYIEHSAGMYDTTGVLAGLMILMALAVVMNELMKVVERRLLAWQQAGS